MFTLLFLSVGTVPTFEVTNKCPSFTVTNKCPAPVAKKVKVTNGFNCGASFCGANGGKGCPSCPNGNGTCACGAKATVKQDLIVQPVYTPSVLTQTLSSCPNGNCPQAQSYTPLFRFRR